MGRRPRPATTAQGDNDVLNRHNARLGSAPDSWGVWMPDSPKQTTGARYLDEIAMAGYRYMEIGPYGFLPTDASELADELAKRDLKVSAGTTGGAFHRADDFKTITREALDVARLAAAVGGTYVVLLPAMYRDLLTGEVRGWTAHVVVLCTGGYGSVYHWSTLAKGSNATATWRAHRHGAYFASPCFLQFHPTALPVSQHWQSKTTLMSESLRNDGRIWVPKKPGDDRPANDIPENERDYYLERKYPSFGNLTPRDVASRNARTQIDSGHGVGPLHNSVYLDFKDAISRLGKETIKERYGNLFDMYLDCTGENPYEVPMRIAPGAHFSMGGLWVDFDQMSNIPGLFVGGEASNNYHGANRLGANSLLSASVDGWFTLPLAVPNYLAGFVGKPVLSTEAPEVRESIAYVEDRINKLTSNNGTRRPEWFHRRLGDILYEGCGVSRDEAGLSRALGEIRELREEFWRDVTVVGSDDRLNQELEKAGRVADFLELAEVMVLDALDRRESAGAHFRTEYATPEGEAKRNDDEWCAVSAWETRPDGTHVRHSEPLNFSLIDLQVRDYR